MSKHSSALYGALLGASTELLAIPAQALRLLGHHLPQIITAVSLGLAGRQAVIWFATWISSFSSFAAMLIMPLAPVCVMVSMIFGLWLLTPSLQSLESSPLPTKQWMQWGGLLSVGALLVPFLSAYASHGMLSDDFAAFRYAATTTEIWNHGFDADTSRSFINSTPLLVALVVVTVLLRKFLGHLIAQKGTNRVLEFIAAYLEVLWMATGSAFVTLQVQRWVLSRRSVAPAFQSISDASAGWDASGFFPGLAAWLTTQLQYAFQFVTVPISWLTLAILVFGSLPGSRANAQNNNRGEAQGSRLRVQALQPVAEPLKTAWSGVRSLGHSGVFPLAVFCLVFTLSNFVEIGLISLGRAIVGPQEELVSEVAGPYILICAKAVYLVVVISLIASAFDHFSRDVQTRSFRNGFESGSSTVT